MSLPVVKIKYSEDQPRDENGRFAGGPGPIDGDRRRQGRVASEKLPKEADKNPSAAGLYRPDQYEKSKQRIRSLLRVFGDEDVRVLYEYGPGGPIDLGASYSGRAVGMFNSPTWSADWDTGDLVFNLDELMTNDPTMSFVDESVRHELSHMRFHYAAYGPRSGQGSVLEFINTNESALRSEGTSMSRYAAAWWARADDPKRSGDISARNLAVTESLAETWAKQGFGWSPTYEKLDQQVMSIWKQRSKS